MLMLEPASILMLEVSRGLLLRFQTGNAGLNLKESMGRLDERSKTQEKKLDEVSKEVKDVSRIVLKAKTAIYTLAAVITLAASVIGWFLSHLIGVFQALQ